MSYRSNTLTQDYDPMARTQPRERVNSPAPVNPPWLPQQAAATQQQPTQPPQQQMTPYTGTVPQTNLQVGLSDIDKRNIYNIARSQTQGATNAMADEMIQRLAGRGFRVGESGIADTALGNIYRGGAERLGQTASELAAEDARNRFTQGLALENLDFGKSRWAQEFGASREDAAMNSLMNYLNMMQGSQATAYAPYWQGVLGTINQPIG